MITLEEFSQTATAFAQLSLSATNFFEVVDKIYIIGTIWSNKNIFNQKQPSICVLVKRCSENMQQIYRMRPIPKCDFNKVETTLRHECSSVNLLHIIRTPFPKNTSGGLPLFNTLREDWFCCEDLKSAQFIILQKYHYSFELFANKMTRNVQKRKSLLKAKKWDTNTALKL